MTVRQPIPDDVHHRSLCFVKPKTNEQRKFIQGYYGAGFLTRIVGFDGVNRYDVEYESETESINGNRVSYHETDLECSDTRSFKDYKGLLRRPPEPEDAEKRKRCYFKNEDAQMAKRLKEHYGEKYYTILIQYRGDSRYSVEYVSDNPDTRNERAEFLASGLEVDVDQPPLQEADTMTEGPENVVAARHPDPDDQLEEGVVYVSPNPADADGYTECYLTEDAPDHLLNLMDTCLFYLVMYEEREEKYLIEAIVTDDPCTDSRMYFWVDEDILLVDEEDQYNPEAEDSIPLDATSLSLPELVEVGVMTNPATTTPYREIYWRDCVYQPLPHDPDTTQINGKLLCYDVKREGWLVLLSVKNEDFMSQLVVLAKPEEVAVWLKPASAPVG